ncbi:Histone-fold [Phytophthora cactorum]|nr:Histone-fold [Phytophthora cactorum]
MAQPAAAGMASTSAASPAQLATSTSSSGAPDEDKMKARGPVPAVSSSTQQKSQNVAATAAQSSAASTETFTASAEAKTSGQSAESTEKSGTDASSMDRAFRTQEEARRLQFALAQQQVEQYQAMTKQLEAQSGITMTPTSNISSSSSTTTTSMTGLAKTSEDLQKLRQEQLARLQQNVQRQAAMAAQAVQKRSNEEWLRSKLLLEQEHLRLLRLHDQQLKQTKGTRYDAEAAEAATGAATATDSATERRPECSQLDDDADVTTTAKPYVTAAPTYYSVKKKKSKTAFDTDLEALAKVCIRVANARTDCEMRQALDKMTSWLQRCTELMLLQIAQRDYRDSLAHRRPLLIQQNRWPLDLQVNNSFPVTDTSAGRRVPVKRDMAAVEREYAELKSQLQAKQLETNQKAKAKRDAAKLEAAKVSNTVTTAAMLAASYKRPLQVEIPGSVKKPRTDATETEDKMYLPPKIISKIMYRALPGDHEEETEPAKGRTPSPAVSPAHSVQELESSQDSISISDDAVTFMQECVTEFLLYFTSESRDLSIMQNRRTKKGVGLSISGSNVVESMENLGFTSYARVLSGYNEKVKASQDAAARKKMERKKLVQQQALEKAIAANAAKTAGKSAISPQSYAHIGMKPAPLTARPVASISSTITRVIPSATTAPTKPLAPPAKPTTPAKPVIPAAPTKRV